ncbi:MAG TPA: MBL fold metallo-hydrolase [Bryobacteraceae bacterium]|nr:MBL fold metallo-hydrolase [Bryobacteraceae bacterium]
MAGPTRRNFLKSAGVAATPSLAAAAPAPPPKKTYRRTRFAPAGRVEQISNNLYVFEDTCEVYVVRDGTRCVLIDFGSGKILDHLRGLGISQVDWILHTHHHRDQCQGDYRAAEQRIPIAVPAHERHLFADVENFWRNRRIFELYYVRNDFNSLTESVPVARNLEDYATFRWNRTDFFVLPTPGHTLGAVTLVADIDGKKVAFSGDLIYAPGKILNLYDTQVNYGGSEGIDLGIYSLARLRELKPELLCPSHGKPLPDPDGAMAETMRRLAEYYTFQTGAEPSDTFRPYAVSPHFVAHYLTTSSFYAILSDSGKAMFIDYGSASGMHFSNFERATDTTDRIRFVEHSINHLKQHYGMKSVDVAIPSHMHDDHMNGFPHLIRHHGTQVWCLDNMVDIFQNPRGHNLGCTLGEPFKVARSFRHGERFKWEEYEFEITHSPGHTEYQMALFVTVDGNRLAFTGDAFFLPNPRNDGTMRHNLIFRNHVENDSHMKSIRNLIDHAPTMIAPGHGKPYAIDQATMLATEQKFRKQQQLFADVLPEGEVNFGLDPSWVHVYPYQMLVAPGDRQRAEVRVRNYKATPMKIEVTLVAPADWRIEPEVLAFEVPANTSAARPVTIGIPRDWTAPAPRFAIAADVMADGKYLGQITEAVVDMKA